MQKEAIETHVKILKELIDSDISGILPDDVLTAYLILIRILMKRIDNE